ncbi:MAG: hypothetical protein IPH13_20605 [Planctomycetes bacterium]|nr:hypothetical protein [Planctomycetota bacterium]
MLNDSMGKKGGEPFMLASDEIDADIVGYVSTGSTELDARLGAGNVLGGIPLGRITEIYGPPSHGKSTFLCSVLASAQHGAVKRIRWTRTPEGAYIPEVTHPATRRVCTLMIDTEGTYDKARGARLGVDAEQMLYMNMRDMPDLESVFGAIEKSLERFGDMNAELPVEERTVLVIGFDTIAATLTAAELDDKAGITQKPRVVAHWLKRLNPLLARAECALIVLNQITQKIGSPGGGYDSSGGHAFHHFATFRLDVRRVGRLEGVDPETGILSRVTPIKAKATAPNFTTTLAILDNYGYSDALTVFNTLTNPAVWPDGKAPIENRGGWMKLTVAGQERSFRAVAWPSMFQQDAELRRYARQLVVDMIHKSRGVVPATVE